MKYSIIKSLSKTEKVVLLCGIIWLFMLLLSMVLFRSTLATLLSPMVLFPKSLLLDDWRDHKCIGYLWLAIQIIGFSSLAILAWRRKSTVLSFLLLSLTILWGILFLALYLRVMYTFKFSF